MKLTSLASHSLNALLLVLLFAAPGAAFAEDEETDNPSLRRQAMDEWYNETYTQHG
jgi:hypothetical protein